MIKLLKWPPSGISFPLFNESFAWDGSESFVETDAAGTIVGGYLGRIQRYGRANNLPEEQWSEQTILATLAKQVTVAREQYFAVPESLPALDLSAPKGQPHWAPLPSTLERSAKKLFPNAKWDVAVPASVLSELTPEQWLKLLRRWKTDHPIAASLAETAGPIWWYAIHSLSANCGALPSDPETWINFWSGEFPCSKCRNHFRQCPVVKPRQWTAMNEYADQAHKWVTANK